jgi:5'-deoxynucleotidase YfbR-like HD superfamily hydrolase
MITVNHTEIATASGNYFDLLKPADSVILIEDIAHALSNICRFTGQTYFYSVAQHSVLVSMIVPPEHALAGLLHDAAEAYIGDVSSPLKALLPDYRAIEARIEEAVLARFDVPTPLPPCVKHADLVALATEKRDLWEDLPGQWDCLNGIDPLPYRIGTVPPSISYEMFMKRFLQITGC